MRILRDGRRRDRRQRRRAAGAGRPRRDADRPVAGPRRGDEGRRPAGQRHGRRLRRSRSRRSTCTRRSRSTEPFDAVFLAVKGYDTEWATMFALRFLGPGRRRRRLPERHQRPARRGGGRPRAHARLRDHDRGRPVRARPRRAHRHRAAASRSASSTAGTTERAGRWSRRSDHAAPTSLTTNLFGERWSKLAVNCMANPLAGLSGYGSAEVRAPSCPRRIAIQVGAEVVRVGRAAGHEVEPLMGIAAQRIVDAAEGRGLAAVEAEMVEVGAQEPGRPAVAAPGRACAVAAPRSTS